MEDDAKRWGEVGTRRDRRGGERMEMEGERRKRHGKRERKRERRWRAMSVIESPRQG
jgi:hypothetical protein